MAGECVAGLAPVLFICGAAMGQGTPADDSKSPREWVAALRGDDPKMREAAAWALYRLGPKAKEAIPDLIAAIDDPRKDVREWAMEALQAMGPAAAPAAAALARKLGDASLEYAPPPAGTWHVAAYILVQIGAPAVPALIEALQSDSNRARRWAAETLGQIGPAAKDAVPVLCRFVEKQGAKKGAPAVKALGRIGPAAAEAIPILHAAYDALKPEENNHAVLLALSQIGAPPSPGLIRRLNDPDPDRRVEAAKLLGTFFGPKAGVAARTRGSPQRSISPIEGLDCRGSHQGRSGKPACLGDPAFGSRSHGARGARAGDIGPEQARYQGRSRGPETQEDRRPERSDA
jgi:HEAT repeat protein